MPEYIFGYEVRKPFPGEDSFFKQRKEVAGMAAEDGKIVLNPYSANTPEQQKIVAQNEAMRLWMDQNKIEPKFNVTPDQKKLFLNTEYGKPENELHLKRSILARIATGDPSAGIPTDMQKKWAEWLKNKLPK